MDSTDHTTRPTRSLEVTQIGTARYYWAHYSAVMPLHWLLPVCVGVAKVLAWRIPALLVSYLVSDLQAGKDTQYVRTLLIAAGCVLLAEVILRVVWHYGNHLQSRVIARVYRESYDNLLQKSLGFHGDNFSGATATKIIKLADGSERFSDFLMDRAPDFIATFLFAVFVIGSEGLVAIGLLIVSFVLFGVVVSPFLRRKNQLQDDRNLKESARTGALVDGITNITAIKSFAHEQHEKTVFDQAVSKAEHATLTGWQYWNWRINSATSVFYVLIAYMPLFYVLYTSGLDDLGRVFIVFYVLDMLSSRVWDLNNLWDSVSTTLTRGAEALTLLRTPDGVVDSAKADTLTVSSPTVDVKNIQFAYEDNDPLYQDFSLSIAAHQKIGLVGPSGGGKTSLMKLVMRFMDVQSGSIEIGGQNIAGVTQTSLRRHVAYIPQEPVLFHRTLRENIMYGDPNASESEMIAAAKKAHAHEFIQDLPGGYDTLVGERGVKLSGGQRQRVAIARVFLKDAPIIMLDEATSALDSESEQLIQDSLAQLMQGRTVISIAHRLSTLQIMDRLVVIEGGAVTESGTHTELLKTKGTYARLWSHQSGEYIE